MNMETAGLVVILVLLLGNIVQSFFVYRSVNTEKANELFLLATQAASKTPTPFDDQLLKQLRELYEGLQALRAQTVENEGCGAEGSDSQKKHWEQG